METDGMSLGWEEEWALFGEEVEEGTDSSQSSVGALTRPGRGGVPKCLACRQSKKKVQFIALTFVNFLV